MDNIIVSESLVVRSYRVDDASTECIQSYVISNNAQLFYSLIAMPGTHQKRIVLNFILHRNAQVTVEILVAHTDAHVEIRCTLVGESSSVVIHGACAVAKENKVVVATVQHHEAAHTQSALKMRSVLNDTAQVSYSGMIRVEKDARFSVSSQENKNIILSDTARAVSVPCLEVLTDDVHCFHGSAIGTFDADYLFYAAARGIAEKEMQRLLVEAFFARMFKNDDIIQLLQRIV